MATTTAVTTHPASMEGFISRQDRTEGFSTTGWNVTEEQNGTSIQTMSITKAAVSGSCHYITGFVVSFGKTGVKPLLTWGGMSYTYNQGTNEWDTYYHQWALKDDSAILQSGHCRNPSNFNFDFASPITITKGNAASLHITDSYAVSGEYCTLSMRGFTVAE